MDIASHLVCALSFLLSFTTWARAVDVIDTVVGGAPKEPLPALEVGLDPIAIAPGDGLSTWILTEDLLWKLEDGQLRHVAGAGVSGFSGDGRDARSARWLSPTDVVATSQYVWIADAGNRRVREIDLGSGEIDTIAGNGLGDGSGDGGPATDASIGAVSAIALGPDGSLWFADRENFRLLRMNRASGSVDTTAGIGIEGPIDSGSAAIASPLGEVIDLHVAADGVAWIVDKSNGVIARVMPGSGLIEVLRTDDSVDSGGDGSGALIEPRRILGDDGKLLWIVDRTPDSGDRVRVVDIETGSLRLLAGGGDEADGETFEKLRLDRVSGGFVSSDQIQLSKRVGHCVLRLDTRRDSMERLAGNGARRFSGDAQVASEALLSQPSDVESDGAGGLWIADSGNSRIRHVDAAGRMRTVLGGGTQPIGVEETRGGDARLRRPVAIAFDSDSGLFVLDEEARELYLLSTTTGHVRRIAGGGTNDDDKGPAIEARLDRPNDIALGSGGTVWIADAGDGRVRRLDSDGNIDTVLGGGFLGGFPGLEVISPCALAFDFEGRLFIADASTGQVAILNTSLGRVDAVLDLLVEQPLALGLGGEIPNSAPCGLAVSPTGSLWVSDRSRHRLFEVDPDHGGRLSHVGSGRAGFAGDGGDASNADLRAPARFFVDGTGLPVFADSGNHRVRRVREIVTTVASIVPGEGSVNGGYEVVIRGSGLLSQDVRVFFGSRESATVTSTEDGSLSVVVPAGLFPPTVVPVRVSIGGSLVVSNLTFRYLNDAPLADADPSDPDDGYLLALGDDLRLDASFSSDPNEGEGDSLGSFEWDLDGDGSPDASGVIVDVPHSSLLDLGLASPGSFAVALTVRDSLGAFAQDQTNVRIVAGDFSIDPSSGALGGGDVVVISGNGMDRVRSVRVGSKTVTDFRAIDDQSLEFTMPPGRIPAGVVGVALEIADDTLPVPGGFTYVNRAPIARAHPNGTAYRIRQGSSVTLDGRSSFDEDEPAGDRIVRYEWDLNGDGKFDRVGRRITVDAKELESFDLVDVLGRSVTLRVTDEHKESSTDSASVRIDPKIFTFPNDDYAQWNGDGDGDKIDDRISVKPLTERVDLVAVFDPSADLGDILSRLEDLSPFNAMVFNRIGAICLRDVLVSDVVDIIGGEQDLFRIEQDERFEALLDVSTAAVKARSSSVYSPKTIEDTGRSGSGVNIAILDSGVDDDHPAFAGSFIAGFDAYRDDYTQVGSQSNPDDDMEFGAVFHGTLVAGIALGQDELFRGTAPGAGLIDVKVLNGLGFGSSARILAGLEWCLLNKDTAWLGAPAENAGIDVINMSLSMRERSDGKDVVSMMVDAVVAAGIPVVTAAGNTGNLGPGIGAPAAADRSISVAAIDDQDTVDRDDDTHYAFSNYGPRDDDGDSDLLEELKPDLVAPGVAVQGPTGGIGALPAVGYRELTGTSMAAPHVAGIVALMLEESPDLEPDEVKQLLRATAEARGAPTDAGLDSVWNPQFGRGIVDAFQAFPSDLPPTDSVWIGSATVDLATQINPRDPPAASTQPASAPYSLGGSQQPLGVTVDRIGRPWFACREDATVVRLNAAGQIRERVDLNALGIATPEDDLIGIATDGDGDVWVTLESQDSVARIFADGNVDAVTYPVGGTGPQAIAVDRSGNLWIANSTSNNVTKMSREGIHAPGSPFAVGTQPVAIVCDRDGGVFVANRGSGTVTELSPGGVTQNEWDVGDQPVEITIDGRGGVWVSNDESSSVTSISADGNTVSTIGVFHGPRGLAVSGDGSVWISIYGGGFDHRVLRMSPEGVLIESVATSFGPLNRGDATGFVYANSVDPDGDFDGDGWSNGVEIDEGRNPFDASEHPVRLDLVSPATGSASGGDSVFLSGLGLEIPSTVFFDGVASPLVLPAIGGIFAITPPAAQFPPVAPVDVRVLLPSGASSTLFDVYQYVNDDPIADADPDAPDDGYTAVQGGGLILDGSASFDPDELVGDSITTYEWTLNSSMWSGEIVELDWNDLVAAGADTAGVYPITLTVTDSLGSSSSDVVDLDILPLGSIAYRRGDVNQDASIDIADPIAGLNWLFQGGSEPPCLDAANSNGDRGVDIADTIYLISHLFLGGPPPQAPYPQCGPGPIQLGCDSSACP